MAEKTAVCVEVVKAGNSRGYGHDILPDRVAGASVTHHKFALFDNLRLSV